MKRHGFKEDSVWHTVEPEYGIYDNQPTGRWTVYVHGEYDYPSVLEGRTGRVFLDTYDTVEQAKASVPDGADCQVHEGSTKHFHNTELPDTPPDWFDPMDAGEEW